MKRSVLFGILTAVILAACATRPLPAPLVVARPSTAPTLEATPVAVASAQEAAPPAASTAPPVEDPVPFGAAIEQAPSSGAAAAALADPESALPLDPSVRYGVLDNGLTYYVRANTEPAKRADLWLAVNAGSVLEDDDQRGLAHFLEHMLFNGTQRFPAGELVSFLESIGMEFGPDVNAYTSFDETVYNLQVPTEDGEVVAKALDILQEWAANATLSETEIDGERGVIVEEWRLRDQTAEGRIRDKLMPAVLGGSQYAERMPIGDMDIVRNAPPDALRRFYRDWYRPDLLSVIAVGDFDPAEVERLIKERFSTLATPAQEKARPSFDVPAQPGTRYLVVKDPENPDTGIEVMLGRPAQPLTNTLQYRELVTGYLADAMLNRRYQEIARQSDPPFLGAGAGGGNFVRSMDTYSLSARVKDEGIVRGLQALVTEFERARRHGFTETELARAKEDVLRFFESAYADRDNRQSSAFAQEYVQHFLRNTASPGIEIEYPLVQGLLSSTTLGEVNARMAGLSDEQGRVVMVTAPDKKDLVLPAEEELAAALETVAKTDIAPYVDQGAGAALMGERPAPVSVTSRQAIPELGVTELTLANGVRVVLKPTDFKDDEVIIYASSPGGSSLVSDADFPEAETISQVVTDSGAGELDQSALEKLLAGKLAGIAPYIAERQEGFSGGAAPKDLETAFQLIYLYATQPRVDEAAFRAMQDRLRADLQNRSLSPDSVFDDATAKLICGTEIRCGPLPLSEVDALDLKRAFEIYRDRFADMGDFTFTITGSFDPQEVEALAQSYLGNLPSNGRKETWRDVTPPLPQGIKEQEVRKGLEDRSRVRLLFTGPFTPTMAYEARLAGLESLLSIQVRDELREARSGTYAPGVRSSWQEFPDPTYRVNVGFASDPKRVDELTKAAFDVIAGVQQQPPSEEEVAKVKEQLRLDHEEALEQNAWWALQLDDRLTSPGGDPLDILRYGDALAALTPEDIQAAARELLPANRYVKVVLNPE